MDEGASPEGVNGRKEFPIFGKIKFPRPSVLK